MTQFLVSVTNVQEAKIALEHGVDIIDLKDPSAGALGALPHATIKSIVAFVDGAKPVSATVGDLSMNNSLQIQELVEAVLHLVEAQVDFIKIGFYVADDYQPCLKALKKIIKMCVPKTVKLIAVLFAEYEYPASLMHETQAAGFVGVMIDTAEKNGKIYSDYQSIETTQSFANAAKARDLSFGLAGSLSLKNIEAAKAFKPNYLGFRGGVCDENVRQAGLNIHKISEIRQLL